MITITNARTKYGWDSADDLVDDSCLDEMIGKSYTSLADARRAGEALCGRRGVLSLEFEQLGKRYLLDASPATGKFRQRVRDV